MAKSNISKKKKQAGLERMSELSKLGSASTLYETEYDPEILEKFENKNPTAPGWVSFVCTEFTSLAQLQVNLISPKFLLIILPIKLWLRVSL